MSNAPERVEEFIAEIAKVLASRREIFRQRWGQVERQAPVRQHTIVREIHETKSQRFGKTHFPGSRIHIYVDASYGPKGFSDIGGICLDSCGKVFGFFSEEAQQDLLEGIKIGDKETAIKEFEMIAISIAAHLWKHLIQSHRASGSAFDG